MASCPGVVFAQDVVEEFPQAQDQSGDPAETPQPLATDATEATARGEAEPSADAWFAETTSALEFELAVEASGWLGGVSTTALPPGHPAAGITAFDVDIEWLGLGLQPDPSAHVDRIAEIAERVFWCPGPRPASPTQVDGGAD